MSITLAITIVWKYLYRYKWSYFECDHKIKTLPLATVRIPANCNSNYFDAQTCQKINVVQSKSISSSQISHSTNRFTIHSFFLSLCVAPKSISHLLTSYLSKVIQMIWVKQFTIFFFFFLFDLILFASKTCWTWFFPFVAIVVKGVQMPSIWTVSRQSVCACVCVRLWLNRWNFWPSFSDRIVTTFFSPMDYFDLSDELLFIAINSKRFWAFKSRIDSFNGKESVQMMAFWCEYNEMIGNSILK